MTERRRPGPGSSPSFESIRRGLQEAIEHAEGRTMNMHDPAPPGELLSRILHGHAAVTADTDLRLSEALGTTPGYWLKLQAQRDLWSAGERAKERPSIERIPGDTA